MTEVNGNLKSGFKGSRNLTVEVDGLQQTAFLLARVTNVEFRKNINAFHGRRIGLLTERARNYFESEVRRPNESGERPNARQTGRFTFGARSGGTFVGLTINDPTNDQYGFGYPDVARADRKTQFVWRTLEFGLRPHPAAIQSEFGPRGSAKFPLRFTFVPFSGSQGRLEPRSGSAGPVGTLVSPRGTVIRKVAHPGIAPKLFITRAFNEIAANMVEGYQTVVAQTYKDFK